MFRVLIVDDEKMIREGIRKVIPWSSMDVEEIYTAGSAREALEICEVHSPDLMITDISMSEMTGLDLIGELRSKNARLRIIVITGYDRFDYAHQALKLKVHDFLLKPLDEDELCRSIQKQLGELAKLQEDRERRAAKERTTGMRQQWKLDQIMWDFVTGKQVAEEKRKVLLQELKSDDRKKLQIGIIVPDLVEEKDKDERDFRFRSIQDICLGMLDQRGLGITFADHAGRILFVLFCGKDGNDGNETARELAEVLRDEYEIRPRMVLGSVVNELEQLHISYNDAVYVLENEKKTFREMVIRNKADQNREILFQDVFREFKNGMIYSVGDGEEVLHIFGRFCMAVESYHLSSKYTERCCFELASAVSFVYMSGSGSYEEEALSALMKSLNGVSRESACELTRTFFERMFSGDNRADHNLISKVKRKIHENLGEDLSVAKLAEDLYVTPNYLSRLFKRTTGEGCNEYIVRKRIEKARALLEGSTLKVGEISQMVGYTDMNYFSLAFKKHTGMSPTKYRALAQGGTEEG